MVERAHLAPSGPEAEPFRVEYLNRSRSLILQWPAAGRLHSRRLSCTPAGVRAVLAELRSLFDDYPSAEVLEAIRQQLATLYDWLLEPLSAQVPADAPLAITACEALFDVPFGALYDRREQRHLLETRLVTVVGACGCRGDLARRPKASARPRRSSTLRQLWPVAENAASRLLADFRERARRTARPDEALRQAQLYQADAGDPELASPGAWGAFVLWGATQSGGVRPRSCSPPARF